VSATEIMIFGSYFKETSPVFDQLIFYIHDHEKQQIRKVENFTGKDDMMIQFGASFTDSVATCKGQIFAFDSYHTYDKKFNRAHVFKISDYL
jgi:hypothetical protein